MTNMQRNQRLIIINFTIIIYFLVITLLYYFQINSQPVQFIVELFTIPFLLAQIVFLVLGINYVIKNPNKSNLTLISVILLAISTMLTFGSFFF